MPSIALLYPGDAAQRRHSDPGSRFGDLFDALRQAGAHAEPCVYHDDVADDARRQLLGVDAVLVWYNPIENGLRRTRLDALLREVAAHGVFVSTHPDTISRLGTKDVLVEVRNLPFGSDVHRVDGLDQLERELPGRLRAGARVLKQHRGQSGAGIWRVALESGSSTRLLVRHAQRGSVEEAMDLPALLDRMAPYFDPEQGGHMIDQAWQPRIAEGMVRAYVVGDTVCGFGHQAVNALHPSVAQPGPRLYSGPDDARFRVLKDLLESDWIGRLCRCVGLSAAELPLLWDCDFMLGERASADVERYVLCEINVSSVSPYPPSCVAPLVSAVLERVRECVCQARRAARV